MTGRARRSGGLALAALLVATAPCVRAAGPLVVNGAGVPLTWQADPVPYHVDQGPLGSLDNAAAVASVDANFAVWNAVPTSDLTAANAGTLPVDVTDDNWPTFLGVCGDGFSPIIFDTDGRIVDDVFGPGASGNILGFAGPECGDFPAATIDEGSAVLNGEFIDGVVGPANNEVSLTAFAAVFIHEFGHYFGLDHSQINLVEATDGVPGNNDAIATMYPILVDGAAMASLNLDDVVSLSTLYPAPSFAADRGVIAGSVLRGDGVTPFQGAYVIARLVGDERVSAVGMASGALYFPANAGGPPAPALEGAWEIPGLPAGDWTIEIERISSGFVGGSSVGPLDPPVPLAGDPEFWNGVDEAATDPPDDGTVAEPIPVAAGVTTSGIDVILSGPPNDSCPLPTVIGGLPYTATLQTAAATSAPSDPLQSCTTGGAASNFNSVWWSFTAPAAMTLVADTVGSSYNTVLTVHGGACGALTELACNDDSSTLGTRSRVGIALDPGQSVLIEVTKFGTGTGGTLVFNAKEAIPPVCAPVPEPCRTPSVGEKSSLQIRDAALDDAKDQLQWKWVRGSATTKLEFGDPLTQDALELCLYDGNGFRASASIPLGGVCAKGKACWIEKPTGYQYRDKELGPDGIAQLLFKAGLDQKAQIQVKGRGVPLDLPAPLSLVSPVTVQLKSASGACFGATFSAPFQKLDATQLKDKAD